MLQRSAHLGERSLEQLLDDALDWARPEGGVVAALAKELDRLLLQRQLDLARRQAVRHLLDLQLTAPRV